MGYLFTSESVSEGHPDKVADQISDAVFGIIMNDDTSYNLACDILVNNGNVVRTEVV